MTDLPHTPPHLGRLVSLLARMDHAGGSVLAHELGISQSMFSRVVKSAGDRILSFGRTRNRRYALPRQIDGVRQPVPVYLVRPRPDPISRIGELHAVGSRGFAFVSEAGTTFFEDLPWFLDNARPAGFLGRLIPRRHPELGLPDDIRLWSGDHCVRFASRFGWDLPGSFIIGDDACSLFLDQADEPSNVVDSDARDAAYPTFVSDMLSFGHAGSSAAGEQPKFIATRRDGNRLTPVLVKFSPPTDQATGRRVADLLMAEHIAAEVLAARGFSVPVNAIVTAGGRVFLESERFDRDGVRHRIGQVTLAVLDAQFGGTNLTGWTASVATLAFAGIIPPDTVRRVRWLETFGRLIGNTDMHLANLSFLLDNTTVTGLAPVYDMLPMHYYPTQAEIPTLDHTLPAIGPDIADVAGPALATAIEYFDRLAGTPDISPSFREIAARSTQRLSALRPRVESLPSPIF